MDSVKSKVTTYTASHWGLYQVEFDSENKAQILPYEKDPNPSAIGYYLNHPDVEALRVNKPSVRRGWLEKRAGGVGAPRGGDEYIEIEWDEALNLVAEELSRVKTEFGNSSIFGGSYGWASAGRFHHAQSQIHRFLNTFGGYVSHKDSYSLGAARPLMHWLVMPMKELMESHTDWQTLADNCELFLSFGGVPHKNAQVSSGGTAEHRVRAGLKTMAEKGTRFVNVSPVKDDIDTGAEVEWWAIRPNTDTALILGLAYSLWEEKLHDLEFLQRYCAGYEVFERYLVGEEDGQPKNAEWAAAITGLPAEKIKALALDLASKRSMINMAWSLQRAHHGDQPPWALISLACMIGQIGLPGGGFGFCYGAENQMGSAYNKLFGPTFSQGKNPVPHFIPVARITDMLLNPGETFTYQGESYQYQDIRLIYWAGGNPFHHHQDLARLAKAWQKPDTIITHEQYWTPSAKMADIVLPATTTLEREDIFYSVREPVIAAMKKVQDPEVDARDDYTIFAQLAARLNIDNAFTEGRTAGQWLEHLYEGWRVRLEEMKQITMPEFNLFWENGLASIPQSPEPVIMLEAFRQDPEANPLQTPTGKIEIFSQSIADFNLPDCPGYACWLEPHEWLGSKRAEEFPLHMISDQPKNKLHSQLDHSPYSRKDKINGREPVYLNTEDAKARGLSYGDLVKVFNQRGACLASAVPSENIRQGVVRLSTGAWFDPVKSLPDSGLLEKHGNPNALTADIPTSSFSQGSTAQTCLVEVEKWQQDCPEITAFVLPQISSVR